jgi:hypothetical protein
MRCGMRYNLLVDGSLPSFTTRIRAIRPGPTVENQLYLPLDPRHDNTLDEEALAQEKDRD